MIYVTNSTEETESIGRILAEKIDTSTTQCSFVALRGEMGVGKTAFVRGFASFFGIGNVKSPTYTVVNEYRGRRTVYHFDMYRIESEDDLYSIGYDEYVSGDGICIVEWSENISDSIPSDAVCVTISRIQDNENQRRIEIV
ncbi:MAG: tRNA (adenosine(37)-N6)-threonylcarbamoyltransferase complex ATPase subunit type 1 TsaE [Ruminococcaceae bacterium]|nr:tRNA (adenosine(37)-N6)-threonylcarbamoyltransferase complex ATPase subunit type 1 TsaE [Oscillospiraceae bacterium]